MVIFYAAVFFIFVGWAVVSRREKIITFEKLSLIQKVFEKMAILLVRKMTGSRRMQGILRWMRPSGVKADLRTLDPSRNYERSEQCYFIRKIRYVLLFSFLADVLAIGLAFSSQQQSVIGENMTIVRPDYGAGDSCTELSASAGTSEIGTFEISVGARQYTEEETQRMAEELFALLSKELAGQNPSLDRVSSDLVMPSSTDGYPFRITWSSNRYELIDPQGNVDSDKLETDEGEQVTLTASLTCQGRKYEKSFDVTVVPRTLTDDEQLRSDVLTAVSDSDTKTAEEELFYLPTEVDGKKISWSEAETDLSIPIFVLVLLAGLFYYRLADRELHTKIEKRKQQLAIDYPQVLSRLVLLVGAGMSVRSSFEKMAGDYLSKKTGGGRKHYVYEEILLMCREIESGVSELDALEHFSSRCGLLSYSRFCSLLSQNLKKGNSELLTALRGEAEEAYAERKNIARQMGEEAGTKLLFPMILMLVVTMIIIMIPAYKSFSL